MMVEIIQFEDAMVINAFAYMLHFRCTEGWWQSTTKILPLLPRCNCQHSIVWLRDIHEGLIIKLNQKGFEIDNHECYAIWGLLKIGTVTNSSIQLPLQHFCNFSKSWKKKRKKKKKLSIKLTRDLVDIVPISLVTHPPVLKG